MHVDLRSLGFYQIVLESVITAFIFPNTEKKIVYFKILLKFNRSFFLSILLLSKVKILAITIEKRTIH